MACAVAFAPGAGARATKASVVDVVGSGTIAWREVVDDAAADLDLAVGDLLQHGDHA